MTILEETLLPLSEAAEDFNGVKIPLKTIRRWVYGGYKGLRLETVNINKIYTSKEAILRFIEQKQNLDQPSTKLKISGNLTSAQVEKELRRHGIID